MSRAKTIKSKFRKKAFDFYAKEVRRKIKQGIYPRRIFGAFGVQKLMLKPGAWTLNMPGGKKKSVEIKKGPFNIPSMDTFWFMTVGNKG